MLDKCYREQSTIVAVVTMFPGGAEDSLRAKFPAYPTPRFRPRAERESVPPDHVVAVIGHTPLDETLEHRARLAALDGAGDETAGSTGGGAGQCPFAGITP